MSNNEKIILSCGFKFCPIPYDTKNHSIYESYDNFARNLRIKNQFINSEPSNNPFHIKNPYFMPNKASNCIETYLNARYYDIKKTLRKIPCKPIYHNIAFKNTIASLTSDDSIIITNADKNMGIVVMNRLNYEREVLRHLNDKEYYQYLEHAPENRVIINEVKHILDRYEKLFIATDKTKYTNIAKFILNLESKKQTSKILYQP